MGTIDSLLEEHALLRRLAEAIEKSIGVKQGVGWDDRMSCETTILRASIERFYDVLREHEKKEDRVIDKILCDCRGNRETVEAEIAKAHVSLNEMTILLSSLFAVCDGAHMYAVRNAAERLKSELEAHLTYEEKVVFPLLSRRPKLV